MRWPFRLALVGTTLAVLLSALWLASRLFTDPAETVPGLAATIEATVASEAVAKGAWVTQSLRYSAASGVEAELIVLRPADEAPAPLLVVACGARDAGGLLTWVPRASSDEERRAWVLVSSPIPDAAPTGSGLERAIELRDRWDDLAACLWIAVDELHAEPWVRPGEIAVCGIDAASGPAALVCGLHPEVTEGAAAFTGPDAEIPQWARGTLAGLVAYGWNRDLEALRSRAVDHTRGYRSFRVGASVNRILRSFASRSVQ